MSAHLRTHLLSLLLFPLTADCGDYVVVTNARQIRLTGKKAEQKVYRSHSQFPGGLKIVPYARMMENKPDMVGYERHGYPGWRAELTLLN